ncbi:MAG: transporter suffix domain-containing protein [Proteobacteria bacterium]|nr:transporter suffix domain-containing protein [Pseudomonadota bacterium]
MSRRALGLALLALSWSLWLLVFAVPWLDVSTKAKVSIAGGIYALSYVAFAGAIGVMGKEAWEQMKDRLPWRS